MKVAHRLVCYFSLTFALALGDTWAESKKPGWKVIYDNDTTNIFSCSSPFNQKPKNPKERFTDQMIRASVAEAALDGVDAMLLQPGHGWIPWWPSKILPLAEHEAWFKARYGVEPNIPVHDYLRQGGDLIGVFLDECRKRGVAGLVSYRLNDSHHLEDIDVKTSGGKAHALSEFYADHPEYRIGKSTSKEDRVQNWLIPEVRQRKLDLITEMVELYPLDGLELDFMRFPNYFPQGTSKKQRVAVMTEFIAQIRALLDRTAAPGTHRWLGARVPINAAEWENIGLDASAWNKAGMEFFNLSPSYRLTEQTSVAKARADAPDAAIYLELTHTPQTWKFGGTGYDDHCYRRSTKEMLENTARIGYARGADGMSVFNFVYYREHGGLKDQRGPFDEPPFDVLSKVANPQGLQTISGYFFLTVENELFKLGQTRTYPMDIVPAEGNGESVLRLQIVTDTESKSDERAPLEKADRGKWTITLNGRKLLPAKETGSLYPFPTPFKAGFGKPEQYLSWRVPANVIKNGINEVEIFAKDIPPAGMRLKWIDITQPVAKGAGSR
jgi:hypothetical protein